jgi:ribosomal-protein-serine acetyltransferase
MNTDYSDGTVRIREYREEDVDALFEAVRESVPELSKWLPWCDEYYRREDSAEWVNSRRYAWEHAVEYSFVIADYSTGDFLGGCGINRIDGLHRTGNLGYWVRTSRASGGIATAAAWLALRFGFEELSLDRIEIIMAVGNTASRRVAERVGARQEGLMRSRLHLRGTTHDAWLYSMLRSDMPSLERSGS